MSDTHKIVVADLEGAHAFQFVLRTPLTEFDHQKRDSIAHLHASDAATLLDLAPYEDNGRIRWVFTETAEEAYRELEQADLLIAKALPIRAEQLEHMPRLKFIYCYGADTSDFDLQALAARGIRLVSRARHAHSVVAEQTFALLLALVRQVRRGDEIVRNAENPYNIRPWRHVNNWAGLTSVTSLRGRTLGIVGFGEIGRLVGRIANSFGMRVLYHQRRALSPELEAELGASYVPLPQLMEEADVVTLHVPLKQETLKLISKDLLEKMKPSGILINTARSRLVDGDALYEMLASGRLGGAGFDVYDLEPVTPGHRWAALENVVLSPHFGSEPVSATIEDVHTALTRCYEEVLAMREPTPTAR